MAMYTRTSPWYSTIQNQMYLENLSIRQIPVNSLDRQYVIDTVYKHRPDILAYDMYGTAELWWVFDQRNMNIIKDPIYDFEPGTTIYVPQKDALLRFLGI